MNNFEILAEISVALLGFSGLVVVLGRSTFAPIGLAVRIQTLLFSGAFALVAALLPIFGIPPLIRTGVAAIATTLFVVWWVRRFIIRAGEVQANPWLTWPIVAFGVLVIGASIYALAWDPAQLNTAYRATLAFYLYLAMSVFVRLILSADPSRIDTD